MAGQGTYLKYARNPNLRIIIRGIVTRGYGMDTYQICIQTRFDTYQILYREYRERPLKSAPNIALRLTHVRERKLAVPTFDYSDDPNVQGKKQNKNWANYGGNCCAREGKSTLFGHSSVHISALSVRVGVSQRFHNLSLSDMQESLHCPPYSIKPQKQRQSPK